MHRIEISFWQWIILEFLKLRFGQSEIKDWNYIENQAITQNKIKNRWLALHINWKIK